MNKVDLRKKLEPAQRLPFDYGAVKDPKVEQQLKDAAAKIHNIQQATGIEIGRALLSVKDSLEHGKFLDWVEAEFVFTRRTAVRMMQVAAEFGDKWDTVSHLPTTVLYKLAAPSTPPAVRDAVLDLKPGEIIGPRGVQAAIAAVKKAEAPKQPSLRKEQREAKRAAEEAQMWERTQKAERRREEEQRVKKALAIRVEALIGDKLPELAKVLDGVDHFTFGTIVADILRVYRITKGIGVRS